MEASTDPGHEVGNKEACLGNDDAIEEETLAIDGGGVLQEDTPVRLLIPRFDSYYYTTILLYSCII